MTKNSPHIPSEMLTKVTFSTVSPFLMTFLFDPGPGGHTGPPGA